MGGVTHEITSSKLLFCADDSSGTLSCVQSSLATDDGLTLRGAPACLASNLSDSVPIVSHLERSTVMRFERLVIGVIVGCEVEVDGDGVS